MDKKWMMGRLLPRLLPTCLFLGLLLALAAPSIAMAVAYSFSGNATYRFFYDDVVSTGLTSQVGQTYDVVGELELGTPTIYNRGLNPSSGRYDFYVYHPITYTFLVGDNRLTGSGVMAIRPIGCGQLFDCWFQNALTTSTGYQHHWEAFDGRFYYGDGSLYPSVFQNTLAYVEPPASFELLGGSFRYGPNFEAGPGLYSFSQNMVFNRLEGVPEPSTVVLLSTGMLGVLILHRRRVRS